jgi:hypothetical protein
MFNPFFHEQSWSLSYMHSGEDNACQGF